MSSRAGRRLLFQSFLEYLSLGPVDFDSAVALYGGMARFGHRYLFSPTKPRTLGQCVRSSKPVLLKSRGLFFRVRPGTEDVGYITPHHKPMVWRWFRPRSGDVVVDVGAGIGFFSMLAAAAGAEVIAIEPSTWTFDTLRENLSLNHFERVEVLRAALGSKSGAADLRTPGRFTGLSTLKGGLTWPSEQVIRSESVPVISLDTIESVRARSTIHWMLIDTEGWEAEVLRGGVETLSKTCQLIIEVEHGPNAQACKQMVEENGLSIVQVERQSEFNEYWFCSR